MRKLKTHNVEASITSLQIGYGGSHISEFGTWAEFETHHWQEPERIEEIVIKWDFLVNIQEYQAPQRHTLLFRVSTELKPGKIFQLLASGNSDEFDKVDMFAAPAFCRVDFINAQISKELVNVIDDWYKGRSSPILIPEAYFWFKKRRRPITEFLDQWFVVSWALMVAACFYWAASRYYNLNVPMHIAGISLFLAFVSVRPMARIGNIFAGRVFKSLEELEGSRVVFEFTSGDKKRISELQQENKRKGTKFVLAAGWNIFLNIVAGIIYAYLFSQGHA